jgi:hypothetical protein
VRKDGGGCEGLTTWRKVTDELGLLSGNAGKGADAGEMDWTDGGDEGDVWAHHRRGGTELAGLAHTDLNDSDIMPSGIGC